jgi:hypothetical protein
VIRRGRLPRLRRARAAPRAAARLAPMVPAAAIRLGTLGIFSLLALTLLASAFGLRGIVHRIRHVSLMWIFVPLALELASKLSFAVLFRLFFRLPGEVARRLAWTAMASSALLPGGGVGGLALGGWLMHLAGVPTRWVLRRSGGLLVLNGAVSALALVAAGLARIAGAPGPHGFYAPSCRPLWYSLRAHRSPR